MNDDDIIEIGKLRRPGQPGANITFDPGHGIRIEDEKVPADPRAAGAWVMAAGGWLRIYKRLERGHPQVEEFITACRKK